MEEKDFLNHCKTPTYKNTDLFELCLTKIQEVLNEEGTTEYKFKLVNQLVNGARMRAYYQLNDLFNF